MRLGEAPRLRLAMELLQQRRLLQQRQQLAVERPRRPLGHQQGVATSATSVLTLLKTRKCCSRTFAVDYGTHNNRLL